MYACFWRWDTIDSLTEKINDGQNSSKEMENRHELHDTSRA
jgi:hypothetical protein